MLDKLFSICNAHEIVQNNVGQFLLPERRRKLVSHVNDHGKYVNRFLIKKLTRVMLGCSDGVFI